MASWKAAMIAVAVVLLHPRWLARAMELAFQLVAPAGTSLSIERIWLIMLRCDGVKLEDAHQRVSVSRAQLVFGALLASRRRLGETVLLVALDGIAVCVTEGHRKRTARPNPAPMKKRSTLQKVAAQPERFRWWSERISLRIRRVHVSTTAGKGTVKVAAEARQILVYGVITETSVVNQSDPLRVQTEVEAPRMCVRSAPDSTGPGDVPSDLLAVTCPRMCLTAAVAVGTGALVDCLMSSTEQLRVCVDPRLAEAMGTILQPAQPIDGTAAPATEEPKPVENKAPPSIPLISLPAAVKVAFETCLLELTEGNGRVLSVKIAEACSMSATCSTEDRARYACHFGFGLASLTSSAARDENDRFGFMRKCQVGDLTGARHAATWRHH
jgi:hypothetical protein